MGDFGRNRRRTLLVDKGYQLDATMIGIVYIVAAAFCLSLPVIHLMRVMNLLLESHSPGMVAAYEAQQRYTVLALVGFFAGLVALWTAFTIWRTHRVAGPVVKVTRHLHQLAAGDFTGRIKLRSRDELKALAESFNQMAESLQDRDRTIQKRIQQAIDTARSHPGDSGAEALNRLSAEVTQAFEDHSPSEVTPPIGREDLVTSDSV